MELQSVKATMLSVRYRNADGNWLIANMREDGKKETFTATGDIPYSETEEPVVLYGEWVEDPKYGKQFKVATAYRVLPTSTIGLRNYLANSEDIKGVGPVRATKLAEHFGIKLLDILDGTPERLAECPGISVELGERIASSWKHDSSLRHLSLFLAKYGISPRWAGKILAQWDPGTAVDRLTKNPYSLTQVNGIGFTTADEMAMAMGWKKDTQERLVAACSYVLTMSVQSGNVFLHEGELIDGVAKLIHPRMKNEENMVKAQEAIKEAINKALADKEIIAEEVSDGVLTLKLLYLPWLYKAEKGLAERLTEINEHKHKIPKNLDTTIAEVQDKQNVKFSEGQLAAIRGAFSNHTVVITGGPGTGKTTCTKAIQKVAETLRLKLLSCAPTGRAAKRLSDITGSTATTIHRMLQWGPTGPRYNAYRKLEVDVLIVDESSMLDLDLANRLFDAIPDSCSVVLIGDADQLPAIGAGTTLRDTIKSNVVPTYILSTIFRQAEQSLIVRNAHLIKQGQMPRFPETKGVKEDSYVIWIPTNHNKEISGRDDVDWLKEKLSRLVSINIPEKFKNGFKPIDPIRDIQVLVPMKKHTMGSIELNKTLQVALNPKGIEFTAGGKTFRYGDRVMQMRNNYDEGMDVYNGDIGFIVSNRSEEKYVEIDFYGRVVNYPYDGVADLQLAYAQTIHKAQGSEFPIVILVMGFQHWPMLERNLLYTANTRAKELCLFMASKGAIEQAVKNNPVKARNTYLAQRLRSLASKELECLNTSLV